MKGIVFVELLGMAEDMLGETVVDQVIEGCDLPSGGAYTAVGDYPCAELLELVRGFSEHTSVPEPELQRLFGRWMMDSFSRNYPRFFAQRTGSFDMLQAIEDEIHVEVRKIYPNAELPRFDLNLVDAKTLEMTYHSTRPLAHFCHGLVEACVERFGETANVSLDDKSQTTGGHAVIVVARH